MFGGEVMRWYMWIIYLQLALFGGEIGIDYLWGGVTAMVCYNLVAENKNRVVISRIGGRCVECACVRFKAYAEEYVRLSLRNRANRKGIRLCMGVLRVGKNKK